MEVSTSGRPVRTSSSSFFGRRDVREWIRVNSELRSASVSLGCDDWRFVLSFDAAMEVFDCCVRLGVVIGEETCCWPDFVATSHSPSSSSVVGTSFKISSNTMVSAWTRKSSSTFPWTSTARSAVGSAPTSSNVFADGMPFESEKELDRDRPLLPPCCISFNARSNADCIGTGSGSGSGTGDADLARTGGEVGMK